MATETIINVTDPDATVGVQGKRGGPYTRPAWQRTFHLSVLSRRDALAESVCLYVYGDRQTRELAEGLEAAARALRSTLPDVEPDDVEVAGDAPVKVALCEGCELSRLAEAGGR